MKIFHDLGLYPRGYSYAIYYIYNYFSLKIVG